MIFEIQSGSKSFGTKTLFKDIHLLIKEKEKVALIGRNGTGKTTLLKVMTGEEELDSGEIHKSGKITIGYLRQQAFEDESLTVKEQLDRIYAPIHALEAEIRAVEEKMKNDTGEAVLTRYAHLQEDFERLGGYTYQNEQKTVFSKFGFSEEDMMRPLKTFSGGQKTRISFVCLLLSRPDLLLLDEPTNHLDLETIEWLESYLKKYPNAVLIASHDRYFMDRIVTKVYELDDEELVLWHGNYTAYMKAKEADQIRKAAAYNRQQKDIARLEALIEKFRYKKNKAAFAQSKIKYLERMDRLEEPGSAKKNFLPRFTAAVKGGKKVLETKDLVIGYDKPLATVNLEVLRGQRIAVIGPNGEGKSTFVKTIVSSVAPLSGEFLLGHQIEIGYFDQELAQFSGDKTVLDELWDEYPELTRTEVRTVLGNFLFSADDVFKEVSVLSGGEKVRLSLAKLMLRQANFLILDEPTNHLDIPGKEALEASLKDYEGTLLVVSHDRWFIDKIADSLLIIKNGKATYYPYTYSEYMEGVLTEKAKAEEEIKKEKTASKPVRRKNWKNEVKRLEKLIEEGEAELERLRELRFDPEYYHDYRKMEELEDQISVQHNLLTGLMAEWEEAEENLANDTNR